MSKFWVLLAQRKYFTPIGRENTLEENVKKKYLENHVEKVEELADGKFYKVVPSLPVVEMIVCDEIIFHFPHSKLHLLLLYQGNCSGEPRHSFIMDGVAKVVLRYQPGHAPSLPLLPQAVWNEETHTLKEKCEGDPLIESVLHSFFLVLKNRSNPRVSHIPPNLTVHVLGEGECRVDPAVGVHHPTRNSIDNAVNGVSKELPHGDDDTAGEDDEGGGLAVKTKHSIVYPYLGELDIMQERLEDIPHKSNLDPHAAPAHYARECYQQSLART